MLIGVSLAVFTAHAQEPGVPRRERAPLAAEDDVEPAVDVGRETRVAIATQPPAARDAVRVAQAPAEPGAPPAEAPAQRALDTLDLGTTSITGNQELPKVLYIVPWKKSDLGDLVGKPLNTLLDEVLTPIDPEVFERHLAYYETLHGDSEEE
jgi:hypothetical protein